VKTGRVLVEISKEFYRPAEVEVLIGDASKVKAALNWAPKTKFIDLVAFMAEADLKRLAESTGATGLDLSN
jgi:GDPmannose 4,6-dehydratase